MFVACPILSVTLTQTGDTTKLILKVFIDFTDMALLFDRHLVGADRRSFDDRHLLTDETYVTSLDRHFAVGWLNY